ncbi:MAG: biotin synthase BioB [Muribaculaceae bacterium]|nr:biotin synthase BioB [Muribaculaceae bacterium]
METVNQLKDIILNGGNITAEQAYDLVEHLDEVRDEIRAAAAEVTRKFCPPVFDSCSIINARSGKCPENCKWCAQSAHHKTSVSVYPLVSREECMKAADLNRSLGVRRFSLVTSGRALRGDELDRACSYYKEMEREGGLKLCASMGLLSAEDLQKLYDSGVHRYHCNLEAAPSFFGELCTTHTVEDKIATIQAARRIGFEVCSGGIIGMGETMRQRVELALTLRRVEPVSIPLNILCPIKGTPLEDAKPLTDNEVLDTVALFRLIHPHVTLRFAGGRAALSRATQLEAMRLGVNGAIIGDLLTTLGSTVKEDKQMAAEAGYEF